MVLRSPCPIPPLTRPRIRSPTRKSRDALLLQRRVQVCARLHQRRRADFRRGRRLGPDDHLITWTKPPRPEWMDEATYATIPDTLTLREIRDCIVVPGRRVRVLLMCAASRLRWCVANCGPPCSLTIWSARLRRQPRCTTNSRGRSASPAPVNTCWRPGRASRRSAKEILSRCQDAARAHRSTRGCQPSRTNRAARTQAPAARLQVDARTARNTPRAAGDAQVARTKEFSTLRVAVGCAPRARRQLRGTGKKGEKHAETTQATRLVKHRERAREAPGW